MGDPGKGRKKYSTPPHPWEGGRIADEDKLVKEYGLKNKQEIWKTEYEVSKFRRQARDLIGLKGDEADKRKAELIGKLVKFGILTKESKLEDVLGLEVRDLLDRRIQTLVFKKGISNNPKEARQLLIHGHIKFRGDRAKAPSALVLKGDEDKIAYSGPPRIPPEKRVPKKKLPEKAEENKEKKAEEKKEGSAEAPPSTPQPPAPEKTEEAPKEEKAEEKPEAKVEDVKPEAPQVEEKPTEKAEVSEPAKEEKNEQSVAGSEEVKNEG